MTPTPLRAASGLCLLLASLPLLAIPQENPNRPPWAQKNKTGSSKTEKPDEASTTPDDAAQSRTTIKVKVNLVNVLVSVLDEHNRPAPDLSVEAFQVLDEDKSIKSA